MYRAISAASLCLLLGGCLASEDGVAARQQASGSLEAMFEPTSSIGKGGGVAAMVAIPRTAGPVTSVKQERAANLQRQEILLGGNVKGVSANRIDVLAVKSETADVMSLAAALPKPSEAGIRAELDQRYPDLNMQVVIKPMRNAAGPFGLAIGKTSRGVRCIYAWQWIENTGGQPNRTSIGVLLGAGATSAVSLRVGLCSAHATVDVLAGYVERITLRPEAIDPQPATVSPSLEASLDGDRVGSTTPADPGPTAEKPKRRHAAKPSHRARAARRKPADHTNAAADADPAPDQPASPPQVRGQAASNAGTTTPAPQSLDQSLPPQAYLGPSAAKPPKAAGTAPASIGVPRLVERP